MRIHCRKSILERRRIKRWQAQLRRNRRKARRARHRSLYGGEKALPVWLKNKLLEYLRRTLTGRDTSRFDSEQNCWIIQIPVEFSFITNPNAALDVLHSVVSVSTKKPRRLVFDHRNCRDMDLGASAALDIIVINVREEWKHRGLFQLGGLYPENEEVKAVFKCMGMTKHLQVVGSEPSPELDASFVKFPLYQGRRQPKDRMTGPSHQEKAATALADHLDRCFKIGAGYSLSVQGRRHVVQWAGEIITNAEEHSEQEEWYAIAYMHPIQAGTSQADASDGIGECQLVIFNFGRSIYESLVDTETPEATREQIQDIAKKHAARSFFSAPAYSEEDLWTLLALQDGISRHTPEPGKLDRGKGTVRMIQAFQALGDTMEKTLEPEMTLVSGTSRIRFTKRYPMREMNFRGGSREIIAFNDFNDLNERPDPRFVHSLTGCFPGTLLTCRFFVDKRYLDARTRQQNRTRENT